MTALIGVELADRDRDLLRAVGQLGYVTGGQLRRLVFGEPLASTQNARIARRVLERLTRRGLLVRATRSLGGIRAGSSSYVYALTRQGALAIGERPRRRHLDPSLTFLQHTLAISETYVQLFEAQHVGLLSGLTIEVEPACWRTLGDSSGSRLKPDLFVGLETAREEVFAFVEIDLGTEHQTAVRRKVALYDAYRATSQEQERIELFPQVIWVVQDPLRGEALARYLAPEVRRNPGLHIVVLANQLLTQLAKGGDHE